MTTSPLHRLTIVLRVPDDSDVKETQFILVSTIAESTWNIELGCQGATDRWWRGSHSLPDAATQAELASRLAMGAVHINGWRPGEDTCMLKVAFDLSQIKKLRVPLKEYDPQVAATRAMRLLLNVVHSPAGRTVCALPPRPLGDISVADIQIREREQTIQELRRKITSLEKSLECKPHLDTPIIAPKKAPTIPKGASLANPSKRRRVVKDMRFDGE